MALPTIPLLLDFQLTRKFHRFPDAVSVLKHSASGTELTPIQTQTQDYLNQSPVVKTWKKARSLRKNTPHYNRYKVNRYDAYHNAARASFSGSATPKQQQLINGLSGEINASKTIAPAGQVLFHGRVDDELTTASPYPAFVSTSLDMIVARQSAIRRTTHLGGFIYVLSLARDMPVLWGQHRRTGEFELLLDCGLVFSISGAPSTAGPFTVIEATVR